jgi:hypothetical protein
MRTYQHSGIVPAAGAWMTVAAGSLAAALLGVAYAFSFYYIPFVYLNLVLVAAFGGGIGLAVGFTAREGKLRNEKVVATLALLAALAGIYAEWGATSYALVEPASLSAQWKQHGVLPFLPHHVLGMMLTLFRDGSWGLHQGSTVHGWPLVALWLIEAGIVIAAATIVAAKQIAERPFCEPCDEWVPGCSPHCYVGNGYEAVWSQVQRGTFENLANTPRADGSEPTYVKLTLHVCESCHESNYLSITACENRTNSKGHRYVVQRKLATNVALTAPQVEIVLAAYEIAPAIGTRLPLAAALGNWTRPAADVELAANEPASELTPTH